MHSRALLLFKYKNYLLLYFKLYKMNKVKNIINNKNFKIF